MLPKRYRLRHAADIQHVQQYGQSWRHPLLILLVIANDAPLSRFGFLASRRVGTAVARNRAKRLLREAVRRHLAEIPPGWDLLLIARRQAATATFDEVETAVLQLFLQAQLLSEAQPSGGNRASG